jgi:DNA modification methylase
VNRVILGNCIDVLKTLDAVSVQCCVTSPPYYGLRDYGTAQWMGGDPECKHDPARPDGGERANRALPLGRGGVYKDICGICGAVRIDEQIGLEETPEAFVEKLVEVFREVRRVLADDGTLWLNLGDSYASAWSVNRGTRSTIGAGAPPLSQRSNRLTGDLKEKDLIGIPWMVAFALRADGWYLRSDIIWHKPNPMPESVTDRPTKAHEYIFLLSKSARYYYDAEAILEPVTGTTHARVSQKVAEQVGSFRANGGAKTNGPMKAVIRTPKQQAAGSGIKNNDSFNNALALPVEERNKRSVWTVTTKPYKEAP